MKPRGASTDVSPVCSMTGFGRAARQEASGAVSASLRSVNHRQLDLHWQTPAELDAALAGWESRLRAHLHRGRIDIRLGWEPVATGTAALDWGAVDAYLAAHAALSQRLGRATDAPTPAELLRTPGVWRTAGAGAEPPLEALTAVLEEALAQLATMRQAEGARLAAALEALLAELGGHCAAIAADAVEMETALRERLRTRLAALLTPAQADDHRLLQEAAFAAERSDTSEELTRLEAHIAHFRALLAAGGEVGKRLDFLAQEMHREANTLLSKTTAGVPAALRITEHGLALKAAIEKIREQVQNVE